MAIASRYGRNRPLASKRWRNSERSIAIAQARHDAAGDEDATARAEREREVAGEAAEKREKELDRLDRDRVAAADARAR